MQGQSVLREIQEGGIGGGLSGRGHEILPKPASEHHQEQGHYRQVQGRGHYFTVRQGRFLPGLSQAGRRVQSLRRAVESACLCLRAAVDEADLADGRDAKPGSRHPPNRNLASAKSN